MEKQAKEYILRNIKAARINKQNLIAKIKHFEADSGRRLTLKNFLQYYHLSLADVYGSQKNRSFERMKVEAGVTKEYKAEYEDLLMKKSIKYFIWIP